MYRENPLSRRRVQCRKKGSFDSVAVSRMRSCLCAQDDSKLYKWGKGAYAFCVQWRNFIVGSRTQRKPSHKAALDHSPSTRSSDILRLVSPSVVTSAKKIVPDERQREAIDR